jgi:hypothetical protein
LASSDVDEWTGYGEMKIFKLLKYFIKTEVVSAVEIALWLTLVKDWDLYLHFITLTPDPLGLKYFIRILWAVLPAIIVYREYRSNEKEINKIFG